MTQARCLKGLTNMKQSESGKKEKKIFYAIFLIIALTFIFLYKGLLFGEKIFTHDAFIWMGSFYYLVESITNGVLPLWDPYSLTGTQFYPNLHGLGLIDPLVFISVFMVKAFKMSVTLSFTYFHLLRLLLFVIGSYYFFKQVTKCRLSSLIAAGVLLMSVAPTTFRQIGILMNVFLTPFILYTFLKLIEKRKDPSKYIYITAFALLNGISFSVFIPVYYVFNFIAFIAVFFIMRFSGWTEIKELFNEKRFAIYSVVVLMLLVFMMAPPYKVFKESKSADGEIFPSVRIVQKNNGLYKKLIASDMSDDALSSKFTKNLGVYSSSGNLLSLIFPDLWLVYFNQTQKLFVERLKHVDIISEAFQYIGILPFIIAVIGFIYSKSRWRWLSLVMLVLIGVNMLSFYGVHLRSSNAVQSAFNAVFPLLKTLEVRETFSAFFLLYLCLLCGLGFKILLDNDGFGAFLRERGRALLIVCGVILTLKIALALYFFKGIPVLSVLDIAAVSLIIVFACMFYLARKGILRHTVFAALLLGISLGDIVYYNVTLKPYIIQKNILDPRIKDAAHIKATDSPDTEFDYFRTPFIIFSGQSLAFSESVFKLKGAMSRGNNHHFVSSKRFYDYFTNVAPVKQLTLGGITEPIVKFFPASAAIMFADRRDALIAMNQASEEDLKTHIYLEAKEAMPLAPDKNPEAASELHQIPDATWLTESNLIELYNNYMRVNGARLDESEQIFVDAIRNHLREVPRVTDFSPNYAVMTVKNNEDGYLYYNDGYSRYWRASDNGKEIKVVPANYNFKAVFLKKGEHTVTFLYDPSGYTTALALYFIGMSSLMILTIYTWVRNRRAIRQKT